MPYIFGGVLSLALLALWLYAILEVITTDSALCRHLPKGAWLILVIFLPSVGSIAWLIAGRPENKRFGIGGGYPARPQTTYRPAPLGIEDRADWPSTARKLMNEPTPEVPDPEAEKQKIRDAADERSRKLREWEARLIQREHNLDKKARGDESAASDDTSGDTSGEPPKNPEA